ncbi:MAG: RdgB/HAM1 family non-canonical purine NTP pyrophosphatase [Chloroflexi bacterium]|nr:RdgB/HAM1 family non-canonical purine NTP pyrophosphatase [Chloroflexota bacterium]
MLRLLLATNNQGKLREYRTLLQELPVKLVTPLGVSAGVEEVGHSLEENAILKAKTLAAQSGLLTLADDSGLEVDALGGAPGHLSARYAGEGASDTDRISYLLKQLEGVPWEKRTARFRCVIAIATPAGQVELCSGECAGIIALEPKGAEGFGYDPIFYLPELGKTMAELPLPMKNQIGHRGKAARQVPQLLQKLQVTTING